MTGPHSPSAGSRAGLMAPPLTTLPAGLEVELDANVHRSRDGRLMLGGSPPRLLRLSRSAARILQPGRFTVADAGTAALARRLVDIGVAHPRPPAQPVRDVTIVIPVRDRADLLDQLLTTLGADPQTSAVPALVVDDGSVNLAAVASVTRRHRATLLVHPRNQGPAAARNTGLGRVSRAGSNGTRTSGRRWTWAAAKPRSCRCPRWPTSPVRRSWSGERRWAADSIPSSGSAKTSTCACGCTTPAGECATFPAPGWAITTAAACVAGSRSEPATGPQRPT